MLMDPDDGSIEHLDASIASVRNCIEDTIPDASLSPPVEAVVAGRVRTIAVGKISPSRSGSQNPEDAIQDVSIIDAWNASRLVR